MTTRPGWHALLAPLPAGAVPRRQPVVSAEVLAGDTGSAVEGWEQLVLHLPAGDAGSRTILVVIDGSGTLLSASDAVLVRRGLDGGAPPADCDAPTMFELESLGGRFEPDGSFRGTHWRTVTIEGGPGGKQERQSARSDPSEADVAALVRVIAEVLSRQPPRGHK